MMVLFFVTSEVVPSGLRTQTEDGRSAGSWELLSPLLMNLCEEEFLSFLLVMFSLSDFLPL